MKTHRIIKLSEAYENPKKNGKLTNPGPSMTQKGMCKSVQQIMDAIEQGRNPNVYTYQHSDIPSNMDFFDLQDNYEYYNNVVEEYNTRQSLSQEETEQTSINEESGTIDT